MVEGRVHKYMMLFSRLIECKAGMGKAGTRDQGRGGGVRDLVWQGALFRKWGTPPAD